jgi:hypothetical protein
MLMKHCSCADCPHFPGRKNQSMVNRDIYPGCSHSKPSKPYAMLGAGPLVATLWKDGSEVVGWQYRFNLFRLADSGAVSQKFTPADLTHFVKLTQLLAAVLADDGCMSAELREELSKLANTLDTFLQSDTPSE